MVTLSAMYLHTTDNVKSAAFKKREYFYFRLAVCCSTQLLTQDVGIFVKDVEKIIKDLEMEGWREQTSSLPPLVCCDVTITKSGYNSE